MQRFRLLQEFTVGERGEFADSSPGGGGSDVVAAVWRIGSRRGGEDFADYPLDLETLIGWGDILR